MFFLILIVILIYIINSSSKSSGSSSSNSSSSSSNSTFHSNSNDEIQTNISRQNISQEGYEFYTKVVGVTFNNRQQYVKQCYNGQQLDLVRDKFNPYDKNAIAIYAGDNQVGFLSKELAQKLAPKMDVGTKFDCYVKSLTGGIDNNYGLNIRINNLCNKHQDIPSSNYYSYNNYQDSYDDDCQWDYDDLCDYYGCEEDDWPE
ncbi:hypothetical protein FYJ38_24365 [Clostridium sp. WB02_MRS01]|uniref:HIRAN domain-containing protein n=1 Tax=Clostridium sp. WB02_MRS01 TaxID=2605777 RepID=UPI0012B216EB|nr:HIRAN domain-containing protein [Clostridium sp. WB02_MRS01]MSS11744.1 hypothetical protein [Clostridium sp. WB02_MRS01]